MVLLLGFDLCGMRVVLFFSAFVSCSNCRGIKWLTRLTSILIGNIRRLS